MGLDLSDTTRPPVGEIMSGGVVVNARQVHRVWRAMVQERDSTETSIPMSVKWMDVQSKLAIEMACSLAGAELGLPVPRGALVLAERIDLPGLPAAAKPLPPSPRYPGRELFLCFGSEHQFPDDTMARLIDDDDAVEEFTWQQFCNFAAAAPAAVWDELAANPDRHTGNLVFDGHRYWLIDHELALEPVASVMHRFVEQAARQTLIDHRAHSNEIAEQLVRRRPADHHMQESPRRFVRVRPRIELLANQVAAWHTGVPAIDNIWPLTEVVLKGIALRLPALAMMIDKRLHTPSGASLWGTSNPI